MFFTETSGNCKFPVLHQLMRAHETFDLSTMRGVIRAITQFIKSRGMRMKSRGEENVIYGGRSRAPGEKLISRRRKSKQRVRLLEFLPPAHPGINCCRRGD